MSERGRLRDEGPDEVRAILRAARRSRPMTDAERGTASPSMSTSGTDARNAPNTIKVISKRFTSAIPAKMKPARMTSAPRLA